MTVTDAHAHDHPDFLAHHFDTPQQQFDAAKLGMWMFLATEVLLFGGLFVGYAVWRGNHPDLFKYGSQFLNTTLGATNTAVLILSSLTMAAAVTMCQRNHKRATLALLGLTLAGAMVFLVIKYFEYSEKFHHGYFPGMKFYEPPDTDAVQWADYPTAEVEPESFHAAPPDVVAATAGLPPSEPSTIPPAASGPDGISIEELASLELPPTEIHHKSHGEHPDPFNDPHRPKNAHMFFNIYFMMTGLHGIHVFVGGIMIVWLMVGTMRGRFGSHYFTPVDLGGLYWHIVDLIWIFLFPLFYLI